MKTYTYNELSQEVQLKALWNCLQYYDYILIQMLDNLYFTKKGEVIRPNTTIEVLL